MGWKFWQRLPAAQKQPQRICEQSLPDRIAGVQSWARSMNMEPVTLECGHVFCCYRRSDGKLYMPGIGNGTPIEDVLKDGCCPLKDFHDENGMARNP